MTNPREQIRRAKLRCTPVRLAIMHELATHGCALAIPALLARLAKHQLAPNKTTLYRQLEQLTAAGLTTKVALPGSIGFEINDDNHHHHFICERCHDMTVIHTPAAETELAHIGNKLQKDGFVPQSHTIDLRGICPNCS